MKSYRFGIVVAATIALATAAVHAATVIIEPDAYANVIAGGPGAKLFTLRPNAAGNAIAYQQVLAVAGGHRTRPARRSSAIRVLSHGEVAVAGTTWTAPGGA